MGIFLAGDAHRQCSVRCCTAECVVIRRSRVYTRGWCKRHIPDIPSLVEALNDG